MLDIYENHYVRRCRECWYDESFDLPKIRKRIIYIDQFGISNMMKALNYRTKAYQKGRIDPFWLTLFEKLDGLSKLQLIVCPDSHTQEMESIVTPYFKSLKRLYELLSHGVSFYFPEEIKRFQVKRHAENWIKGNSDEPIIFEPETLMRGKPHKWSSQLIISIGFNRQPKEIDSIRKSRESTNNILNQIFQRWQKEQGKTFEDWFNEEIGGFGKGILAEYFRHIKNFVEIQYGLKKLSINNIMPSSSVTIFTDIKDTFLRAGVPKKEILTKIAEYFSSPTLKAVPSVKITAMLYAALARQAAAGRKKPLNQGTVNDIETISSILPYCDAMFIDKEFYTLLQEKPLVDEIRYGTAIFSLKNKEEFLDFLDKIRNNAPEEHIKKVKEVYGKDTPRPYTTLFQMEDPDNIKN